MRAICISRIKDLFLGGVCIAQYGFIVPALCNTGNKILGTRKINMKITHP